MKSYSQLDEQYHILRYFGNGVGTFLDIGANDGKTFSNTYALSLLGWSGVCVDASPRAFASLTATHANNDKITCLHAAVTNEDGSIVLHEASDTLVSSLDAGQPKAWASYGFEWNDVEVPAMTVPTMLAKACRSQFDFVNIDVESHDIVILQQMNLEAMGVKMLCVEHNNRFDAIKALCPGFREWHRNGINLLMVK